MRHSTASLTSTWLSSSAKARPLAPKADRYFRSLFDEYEIFGGRQLELERIDRFIAGEGGGYFFVTGHAGFGKTALLVELTRRLQENAIPTAFHFITPRVDVGGREPA